MDEKLVTILLFESTTCCVRRKVIRKGVGNVTKNGKALLAKIHEICCEEI